MLRTFLNAFRVADIRKKLAFTAGMLALYRIGAYIPAPGINVDAVENISENFGGSNVLGFLNLFSGGSLQRFAIFALGIMPYITASIMLQLLTVVIPQLDKLRKEGTQVTLLGPTPDDLRAFGANVMDGSRRLLVLDTSTWTTERTLRRIARDQLADAG